MSVPFETQLEALGEDLLALDEGEARAALVETQKQIDRLTRHANRLRVALELRSAWLSATEEAVRATAGPSKGGAAATNGSKKPKTKDVLSAAFRAEPDRDFTTRELRTILEDHGITITPEGARLALRRLAADGVIFKPDDGRYRLKPSELAIEHS